MNIITSGYLMIAAVCFTLGIIHLRFWLADRARLDYLAFIIVCFSVLVFSAFEHSMMHTVDAEAYNFWLRWSHLASSAALISIGWFAYLNLGGRWWLFQSFCLVRLVSVILNFIVSPNINFSEVREMGSVQLFGETLSYPIGTPNPLTLIPQLSVVLLVVFCFDSSYLVYRRGERLKGLTFGVGAFLFAVLAFTSALAVAWGLVPMPFLASPGLVCVIIAMLFELSHDMQRSALLSEQLIDREAELNETLKQLTLSADAGQVGMWMRKIGDDRLYVSDKTREFYGFSPSQPTVLKEFLRKIHPADLPRVQENLTRSEASGQEWQFEYRIMQEDGSVRWMESRGKIDLIKGGIKVLRGAIVDITKRKLAEEAVHELSRKLMNAQEKERARLARELHDDLSQSLALLSIQLAELRQKNDNPESIRNHVGHLVTEVERLSSDVHRISHELHPAKLSQLGLESALKSFCREMRAAHPVRIDFKAENVSLSLPNDVSLCLYRVVQESLQNIIKHSGARTATVSLRQTASDIRLTVSDNGSGFDPVSVRSKESLGLISIDERVRAVNGKAQISSRIGEGTKIKVTIPLEQKNKTPLTAS